MRRLLPFLPAAVVAATVIALVLGSEPSPAAAADPPPQAGQAGQTGKGPVVIDVSGPRRDLYKMAVPRLIGDPDTANLMAEIVSGDLASSGWFKLLDPRSFLANAENEGLNIQIQDWRNVGAEGVSKGRTVVSAGELSVDFKLYELGRGAQPVLEKSYKGPAGEARKFAHAWSAEVVKYMTGEDSFFDTQIAFAAPSGAGTKDIFVMDYDGNGARRLTQNGSQNILPAWSPSGGQVAFTSFLRGNPDLYTVGLGGGRPKRIASYTGVNMGASYAPDGSRIAVTLSQDGNPEIYLLEATGKIIKRLTDNPLIDSSPNWSPDGGRIAFVSNRYGSPQVWVMGADGSGQTRLTRRGNYNQEPAWCPRCPAPTVAFTARDERLNFDIFTIGVESGEIVRITENQGQNEHATWAPTGRALAFSSSRGGIWLSSPDGKVQRQLYRGNATTPVWGPARH